MNENLPQIQQKSDEMRQIYRRIDKLEVSVRDFQFKIFKEFLNAVGDQQISRPDIGFLVTPLIKI